MRLSMILFCTSTIFNGWRHCNVEGVKKKKKLYAAAQASYFCFLDTNIRFFCSELCLSYFSPLILYHRYGVWYEKTAADYFWYTSLTDLLDIIVVDGVEGYSIYHIKKMMWFELYFELLWIDHHCSHMSLILITPSAISSSRIRVNIGGMWI